MSFKKLLKEKELLGLFQQGSHQIISSFVRTDQDAYISKTPVPDIFLDPAHAYVRAKEDQTQIYIRTLPNKSVEETHRYLEALYDVIYRNIPKDEMVWPFTTYRRDDKKYLSPIEYRFSFSKKFEKAFEKAGGSMEDLTEKTKDNYIFYEWLVVYLFGATPVTYTNYLEEIQKDKYSSQMLFVRSASQMPDMEEVVFKNHKKEHPHETGEFYVYLDRQFDEFASISKETLIFMYYFFLYMAWIDENHDSSEEKRHAQESKRAHAIAHPFTESDQKERALKIIDEMLAMMNDLGSTEKHRDVISTFKKSIENPLESIAAQVIQKTKSYSNFIDIAREFALSHRNTAYAEPYFLKGFEGMELSTQILMFDLIRLGIRVSVLDEYDQFIQLEYKGHIEWIKKGNISSHVSFVAAEAMENKTVTKHILREAGFNVPGGEQYVTVQEALEAYPLFQSMNIVIKPVAANAGRGVSVFNQGATFGQYKLAVEEAMAEGDQGIIVEEYYPGTEYRIHVVNGKSESVLYRYPANVIGDGEHTVCELVDIKNQDPLRGEGHRTPLEKIKLDRITQQVLEEQGLTEKTILEKDQLALLRQNSNISMGGDSIDYTDQMDISYRNIAAGIAKALDAKVCGVDMIIPDPTVPSTPDNPGYVCIEANGNPAMYAHVYLYKGRGQRLTLNTIDMIFPELDLFSKNIPSDCLDC